MKRSPDDGWHGVPVSATDAGNNADEFGGRLFGENEEHWDASMRQADGKMDPKRSYNRISLMAG